MLEVWLKLILAQAIWLQNLASAEKPHLLSTAI
jgi:hypothetical protein